MSMVGHNLPNTSGWVAFSRKLRDHSLVGMGQQVKPLDPKDRFTASRMEAWVDLIWMAAYQETETVIKGHKVMLARGDLIASRSFLSKRWNWSQMIVRTFLNNLEKEGMITKDRTGKGEHPNLIRVCKYDHYQVDMKGFYANEVSNQANYELSDCNQSINCDGQLSKQPSSNQAISQPSNQAASQLDNQAENSLNDCKIKENCKLEIEEQPSKEPAKQPSNQPSNQPQNINNNKQNKKDICPTEKSKTQIALDEYNQLAERVGLSRVKALSKSRLTSLRARLKEHGLDGWRQALENVERSSFLCGDQKGRDWKASFDFLLQQSSFLKVIEGQYGNGRVRKPQISQKRAKELKAKYAAPPPIISEDAR